ncbi:hypothetical protein MTO96_020301 [Rhipicephalus appendiculatus]
MGHFAIPSTEVDANSACQHLDPLDDEDVSPIIPSPIQQTLVSPHPTRDAGSGVTTAPGTPRERDPLQQAPSSDAVLSQSATRTPPIASHPSGDPGVFPSQQQVTCQTQEAADSSLRRYTRPRNAPTRFADYIT